MSEKGYSLSVHDQEERLREFYGQFKEQGLNNVNGLLKFLEVYREEQKWQNVRSVKNESFERLSSLIENAKSGLSLLENRIQSFSHCGGRLKNEKKRKEFNSEVVSQLSELISQNEECDWKLNRMRQELGDIRRHISEGNRIENERTTQCTEHVSNRQGESGRWQQQLEEKRFSFNIQDATDLREFIIYTQSQQNSQTHASEE